jgi:glutamate 5-kinase
VSPGRAFRRTFPSPVRSAVVKVGSGVLTSLESAGGPERIRALASDLARLHATGMDLVLVTSGAVAGGMERLGWTARPRAITEVQAASAIGQGVLMHAYAEAFRAHGITVAQVLLTHADLADRGRYLNVRGAFDTLRRERVLPIVNENDVTSVEEITFGDNDRLAALLTGVVEAELLVLLTTSDGLHEQDPRLHPGSPRVGRVEEVSPEIEALARETASSIGRGGMASKVQAARIAGRLGVWVVIANGLKAGTLERAVAGDDVGTVFVPSGKLVSSRQHWIAYTRRPQGELTIDDGALRALVQGGKSLLPRGVREVRGTFASGDAVRVVGLDGREVARGLASYGSEQIERIRGRHSREIESILGYRYTDEVIHRDDLVVTLDPGNS